MKKAIHIRTITLILIIISILATLYILSRPYTRTINNTLDGLQIQRGSVHVTSVQIQIHGTLRYSLFGKRIFRGTIHASGNEFTDPNGDRTLQMRIYKAGDAWMSWVMTYELPQGTEFWNPKFNSIFTNKDFSHLAIEVADPHERVLLSAPAISKSEAWSNAQNLMQDYLEQHKQPALLDRDHILNDR